MLGFFSKKKSEHPLADDNEVARVCTEIGAREPLVAVKEASAWFEALAKVSDFELLMLVDRVLQLDTAAAPQARRLGRDFISRSGTSRQLEVRIWETSREYWEQVVNAYDAVLLRLKEDPKEASSIKALQALTYARSIHARAGLLKWDHFHYGPYTGEFWQGLGGLLLDAEAAACSRQKLALFPNWPPTTVEAEYLKVLLFHASALDSLMPLEIELAERLITHFLPRFTMTREVRPENVYWVDAARPVPPTRLAKVPAVTPTLRFFSGGDVLAAIEQMLTRMDAEQQIPGDLNLGGQYPMESVSKVLQHIAACWAPKPPMRTHARHRIKSHLVVAHGIGDVHGYLSGRIVDHIKVEFWVAEDVSQGGMAAAVPISRMDWIRIGVMVAMQPEGGHNWLVGVVRRFVRNSVTEGRVGIETLAKNPVAIVAEAGGMVTEAIVIEPVEAGAYTRIALPAGVMQENLPMTFEYDGKPVRAIPWETLDTGADFEIGKFYVQSVG